MRAACLALMLTACGDEGATTGTLEGRVALRDAETATAEGLSVQIDGPQFETVLVDGEGAYASPELLPGSYEIQVTLTPWSLEGVVRAQVEVEADEVATAPDLALTPAGSIHGRVSVQGGISAFGVRLQLLGTDRTAATDESGAFAIHRVPRGIYELVAEKAEAGSVRRGGILVTPFAQTDVGTLLIIPGGTVLDNEHPFFVVDTVEIITNGSPIGAAVRPLPYRVPQGTVRRFDYVGLRA
ncbi:hypothetical protein ACFL6C_11640, partial [Myxococcota bacterium]